MPNVMGVLRAEIRRLARKETKQELNSMRKQVTQMRRLLAESRRRVSDLEARVKQAMRAGGGVAAREAADEDGGTQVRFSPAWVKKHRSKLGMSRLLYAQLVGVSPQTIMGWEAGRTRPRPGALRAWRAIRGRGVRELRAMLANGSGGDASPVRKRRRRLKRAVRRARVRGAIRRVRRTVKRARVRRAVRARVARKRTVRRVRAGKKK